MLHDGYLPKDFIETAEGLLFAVVAGTEMVNGQERVLCFLRYVRNTALNPLSLGEMARAGGIGPINETAPSWHKVNTETANRYLKSHFPAYLHHSAALDADLHAVPVDSILTHHQPRKRLQQLRQRPARDKVEGDVLTLCGLFAQYGLDLTQAGITGSVLLGAQNPASDIDLVIYDRDVFHQARRITVTLIRQGQLSHLNDNDWQESYARRSCELTLAEYVWHEQRKFNKGMVNRRKFDLNYVAKADKLIETKTYHKKGKLTLEARITQDEHSFDYPAIYRIDHPDISTVVCFIATYTGQARVGESVEISGLVEQDEAGEKHIVVGSSREAPGEYIRVVRS
jgi:predicted nucleotidyltransferase